MNLPPPLNAYVVFIKKTVFFSNIEALFVRWLLLYSLENII